MSNRLTRRRADPAYRATITIGLLPTGQVQVTGPLHMKVMCEQMLQEAFVVLAKYHAETETPESSIITPEPTKIILAN